MSGIVLVDKPPGISSHDAIYQVRRALGIRKIGHTGTLDPIATGLLVMAVAEATRFLPYLDTNPKVYEGAAQLGISTTTQDSEGEVIAERPIEGMNLDTIKSAASRFIGEIEQVPPMFSAIKIDGKRLYKLARQGLEVERKPRTVSVSEFVPLAYEAGRLAFRVACSTGTYVRTLVHDLGEALGTGGHMTALRRTSMGGFQVAHARLPEDCGVGDLLPLEEALSPIPTIRLPEDVALRARQGNEFAFAGEVPGTFLGLLDDAGFFAVAKKLEEGRWRPERVVPPRH
ncbi:MAG: tRNA pseudouridine(55) synthase TruB [Armatimonadota bacterium]|nr:tRNA pseudouridine(55) synthase TruB [Armatimonadota bacterium]